MTINENHDAPSYTRFETCNNDGTSRWSDLNQDLLFLVLMQLGAFDYPAFSGVCKSWRSFALSDKFKFMASRSPMSLRISTYFCDKKSYGYLEDPEGRKFKTTLPYSGESTYIGSTYGYLILFSRTRDFWLVNPITRHELHFPCSPFESMILADVKGIVVFLRSLRRWVFVVRVGCNSDNILFSIAGRGTWKRVSSTCPIADLDAFKGKIYTLNNACHLCELRLNQEPKLILLETKNFPIFARYQQLVSSCKNLYLREYFSEDSYKFHKLDFNEMSWVSCEKTKEECAFIHSTLKHSADAKNVEVFSENMCYIPMIDSKFIL